MADFKQAIEWLKEGKKIRRKNELWYIQCNNQLVLFSVETNGLIAHQGMFIGDLEATDWEIYCEEHDWGTITPFGKSKPTLRACRNCGEQEDIEYPKESLSDSIKSVHAAEIKGGEKGITFGAEILLTIDVKKHIQNAQRRLKEVIKSDYVKGLKIRALDIIFKEEFGDKLNGTN